MRNDQVARAGVRPAAGFGHPPVPGKARTVMPKRARVARVRAHARDGRARSGLVRLCAALAVPRRVVLLLIVVFDRARVVHVVPRALDRRALEDLRCEALVRRTHSGDGRRAGGAGDVKRSTHRGVVFGQLFLWVGDVRRGQHLTRARVDCVSRLPV
jgi:hypothetical protein